MKGTRRWLRPAGFLFLINMLSNPVIHCRMGKLPFGCALHG
jgi:hypothetical protein